MDAEHRFSVNNIRIIANNEFLKANPVAKKWFELVTIPIDDVNKENLQIQEGQKSFEDIRHHAEEWIAGHQQQFDAWLEEAKAAK